MGVIILLAIGIFISYKLYKKFGFVKGWTVGVSTFVGLIVAFVLLAFFMQACN
ncbi:MAG: hypothetical protein MJ033_00420 [Victivallaceae bacterium]|nr:hypothetical protein [Victivallaceae bacterium]